MTEHFSFFDAIQDSNGHYDREYNAQQFTDYFKSLVTTGVMKGAYNQLEVTANGANMVSAVKSGVAFVEGRYYYNDALLQLTHDTEVVGLSRIDRIVVRMDLSTEARHVKAFIKKGVPSNNPVAPTLTQTPTVYEISLGQVRIVGGQTFIATNAVTDERGKDVICPWAGSKILPNFDNNFVLEELENKADKQLGEELTLALTAGWTHGSGITKPVTFFKDSFGMIHIDGTINGPGSSIIGTLPEGYRPKIRINFVGLGYNGTEIVPVTVGVYPDGRVILDAMNSVTLSGSFRSSGV